MSQHALPRTLTPGSKLHAVYVVVRDRGPVTPDEVAAVVGWQAHSLGPLLWTLCHMRAACHTRRWDGQSVYAAGRLRRWL